MEENKKNKIFILSGCIIAVLVIVMVVVIFPQMQFKTSKQNNYNDENANAESVTINDGGGGCSNYTSWEPVGGYSTPSTSYGSCVRTPPSTGTDCCIIEREMTGAEAAGECGPSATVCYVTRNYHRTCQSTSLGKAQITCNNVTYDGTEHTIASCPNCVSLSGANHTTPGSYTVTGTPKSNYEAPDSATCHIYYSKTATIGQCQNNRNALLSGGQHVTYVDNSVDETSTETTHTVSIRANTGYQFSDGTTTKTYDCPVPASSASNSKCFCNQDETSCTWASSGSQTHSKPTNYDETTCRGKTMRSCCYKEGNTYVYGTKMTSECEQDKIDLTKTQCESLNTNITCETAGYYCASGSTTAQKCPTTSYCPDGRSDAVPCPTGSRTASQGAVDETQCSVCNSGYVKSSDNKCRQRVEGCYGYANSQGIGSILGWGDGSEYPSNSSVLGGVSRDNCIPTGSIGDPTHDEYCFKDASGEYYWGRTWSANSNLTHVPGIYKQSDCHGSGSNVYKCYCNSSDTNTNKSCLWMTSKTTNYSYVSTSISNESECVNTNCSISVSSSSSYVSITKNGTNDENSYYTVTVSTNGSGCVGQTLTYTVDNGNPDRSSDAITSATQSFTFNVYPIDNCKPTTATATTTSGKTGSHTIVVDHVKTDWQRHEAQDCWKANGAVNTSFSQADANEHGWRYYYEQPMTCKDGTSGYKIYWSRTDACGSSPTPSTPSEYACYADTNDLKTATKADWLTGPTKELPNKITKDVNGKDITTSTQCDIPHETLVCYANAGSLDEATESSMLSKAQGKLKYVIKDSAGNPITDKSKCVASACYKNSATGEYQWGTIGSLGSAYEKVDTILSRDACKKAESCMIKTSKDGNDLVWATTQDQINDLLTKGYTKSNVSYEDCQLTSKCYTNGTDYKISNSPIDGYTETTMDNCAAKPDEVDRCYVHKLSDGTVKYEWGKYESSGYTPISIEKEYCVTTPSCYLNTKDNKYYTGDYSLNDDYSMVDESYCSVVPDVPPTAANRQVVVYIGMILLALAGIGLVYYGNYRKRSI